MDVTVTDEKPPNDRVVGKEYGVAGKAQLEEIKAVREASLPPGFYYPPGATEPIEE
jgi:hypothetical protein